MPIIVERIDPDPVLVYRFSGRITLGDLEALRAQEAPHFSTVQPDDCLRIILDLSELYTIPAELFAPLQHTRLVRDRRVCVVSVVGANAYLRALAMNGHLSPGANSTAPAAARPTGR